MAENENNYQDLDPSEILDEASDSAVSPGEKKLILSDQALPRALPVLPVNSQVVYPTLLAPLLVTLPGQIEMVEGVIGRQRALGLILTRKAEATDDTRSQDLFNLGVVVKILKRLRMPDGSVNLLVHSIKRFRIRRVLSDGPSIVVEPEYLEDITEKSTEMDALTRAVISNVKKLAETNPFFTDEMRLAMINAPGPSTVADLVAFALSLPKADAQDFLETLAVKARFEKLLVHLRKEQDVADVQRKINEDVNAKVGKLQREFFLKEQLRAIKRELGMEEDGKDKSSRSFRERIVEAKMPPEAEKLALEELEKFETTTETSPEYNVSRNYLEVLCSLPWSKETKDNLDLDRAREVLDADHYGLDKVKQRILEFLAVRKLREERGTLPNPPNPPDPDKPEIPPAGGNVDSGRPLGSIICLVGPPGVGKTSVGKSIARTLGRSFFRFSLGGMRDEAEIKGHRRTYVGAMPGKVIQGLRRAGTKNAIVMLDEIDKLGQSFMGDPASALLEVLDPEQNSAFLDHYLDIPFDLSRVLFIVTANTTATIPPPLLDRMEVIEIPGYTLEEKEEIAVRFVLPREFEANAIPEGALRIDKAALRQMMLDYAREPGLRTLQQLVGKIARKAAAQIVGWKPGSPKAPIIVTVSDLSKWLGPKRFYNEIAERITAPGVVVGLAWTQLGGDILFIEATDFPGSGALKLTGQMGEVMTESASIAWSYVRKRAAQELGLERKFFRSRDFHLHIPAGAIPKDGPSAGVTMAAALYSLVSERRARHRVAMTGELSLIGKVLPVGGIKEKVLAARRAGVLELILPKLNEKDLAEVPAYAKKGMVFHLVSRIEEVLELALSPAGAQTGRVLRVRRLGREAAKRNPSPAARRARIRVQFTRSQAAKSR
jgi:ATP-dependent Lon protease